jgi:beta-glucosidase
MKKIILVLCMMMQQTIASAQEAPQLKAANIDQVLGAMTLEEKAQLLVGGGHDGFVGSGAMLGHQKKLVAGAAGITVAIPRLGIPATVLCDGPAGVHIDGTRKGTDLTFYATGFPIGTCLACTWNTELVEQVGRAIGNETLEYGCDVILGPGLNIHRNPLCGRNFEYYSEDPLVTGMIGAACVKGIQSQGVGVSIKHFAVNSQEGDRTRVSENVSPRALREIYLRGFERVVCESSPWTVMSSYNKINGVYAMGNKDLLTDVLRNDWGYQGIVMSDWIGKRSDLPTEQEVSAGNDLMMPGYGAQVADIVSAVKAGRLDIKDVDRNVRRMLEYIVKTPRFKGYKYSDKPDTKAHAAITRQSSTEGMVLLKNEKYRVNSEEYATALPLNNKVKTVALFGVNSYDFFSGGLGSGCVNVPYVVDMVTGLKNNGIATTPALTEIYQDYVQYARKKLLLDKNPEMWFLDQGQPKLDEIVITDRAIQHELRQADAAIITIGRQAGEGIDRAIEDEFNLSQIERDIISRVSQAFHAAGKPVIVVINSGSVIETASWRDLVDAILVAWQPGQEGGNSVADVLTGRQNPSGKLTMTWPIAATDHPSTANFPQRPDYYNLSEKLYGQHMKGVNYTDHEEDIYVGYRYFDTFSRRVAYPFGYGLSYTTFGYEKAKVRKLKNEDIEVTVTVKNTGNCAGKEIVQVYVAAPSVSLQHPTPSLEKPAKELKTFAKTRLLQPGESQMLTMTIAHRDLASFDEAQSQWVVDAGRYEVLIGASCADIRQQASVDVKAYTEPVSNSLPLQRKLKTLRRR